MSAVFDVADAFVTAFRGMTGYNAPGGTGTVVYDGVANVDVGSSWLVVGGSSPFADDDAEAVVGSTDGVWRTMPLSSGHRTETVTTSCVAGAWTGDAPGGVPDWSGLRATLATIVDDVESRLRDTDACDIADVHSFELTNGRLSQEFAEDGCFAIFAFDVVTTLSI